MQPTPILTMVTTGNLLRYKVFEVRIVHYFMLSPSICYLILITAGLIPLAIGTRVIK